MQSDSQSISETVSESDLDQVRKWLDSSKSISVLTGAGISAESGVPTFRGTGGLWREYRAEDLATPGAFSRDPKLVWEWYQMRREIIAGCSHNAGHSVLAALEEFIEQLTLITQCVDGLHSAAGSRNVLELHGSLWKTRCTGCGDLRDDRRPNLPMPPFCNICGDPLRPHVVWFGENLDFDTLQSAVNAAASCDVFLVVGTSAVVQPAASLAIAARNAGAKVVEINPETTPMTSIATVSFRGAAGVILPMLVPGR